VTRWGIVSTIKAPLAEMQADKLYTPGPEGYADYPALSETAAA